VEYMLKVRFTTLEDVPQCVALSRDAPLLSDALRQSRIQAWQDWLREGVATSAVVVDEENTIYAFGLTAAVSDNFVASIRNSPPNRFASLAISSTHSRCCVVSSSSLLRAHRGDGVNLIGFYGWRELPESVLLNQAKDLLLQGFLHLHRGLHLKMFMKEVFGEEELQSYIDMGCEVYRSTNDYPNTLRRYQPALVGLDRELFQQRRRQTTLLFQIFAHQPPRLKLSRRSLLMVQMAYHLELDNEHILKLLSKLDLLRSRRRQAVHSSPPQGTQQMTESDWRRRQQVLLRQQWCRIYRACDKAYGTLRHRGSRNRWHSFLRRVSRYPEIAFPLQIGRYLSVSPQLAREYPLPLEPRAR
jgi:hypothetical protein